MKLIPLTRGQFAKVDDKDFEWLSQYSWQAHQNSVSKRFYVTSGRWKQNALSMHRLILGIELPLVPDHINGDGLDNQRNNLRIATATQNRINSRRMSNNKSGYKGVYWFKPKNRWYVKLQVDGKQIHLGSFRKEQIIQAAQAYDEAARKYYGEFAYTNFT